LTSFLIYFSLSPVFRGCLVFDEGDSDSLAPVFLAVEVLTNDEPPVFASFICEDDERRSAKA
jgi:hypothetical protein